MCNQWLGGWRVPFPGILGGFETRQKQFFAYFWSQEKNQKKEIFQEISVFIGKNQRFFTDFFFFRFFHPNIFSSTTEIRFFSEKSTEIGDFFVHGLTAGSVCLPTLSSLECMNQYRAFHPRECLALLANPTQVLTISCNHATLLDFVQRH